MKKKDLLSFGGAIALVLIATAAAVVLIMTENKQRVNPAEATEEYSTENGTEYSLSADGVSGYVALENEDKAAAQEFDNSDVDDEQWISDYEYILENLDSEDYPDTALIYVDDDEVPELLLKGNPGRIYTWHDGETDFIEIDYDTFIFSERGNLLTTGGKTYKIKNSEFVETDDSIDKKDEAYLSETYSYEELETMLKSGEVTASAIIQNELEEGEETYDEDDDDDDDDDEQDTFDANDDEIHSYEFVIGDYSWTSAYESVQSDGKKRYLARITSEDEFLYVCNLIKESNLQNYQFWLGAKRDKDSTVYYWINNEGEISEEPITTDGIYEGAWASGEPSYTGNGDSESDVEETCLMMYYDLANDVFKWKDVPDKILSSSPSLAGKIGYIIETEDD